MVIDIINKYIRLRNYSVKGLSGQLKSKYSISQSTTYRIIGRKSQPTFTHICCIANELDISSEDWAQMRSAYKNCHNDEAAFDF